MTKEEALSEATGELVKMLKEAHGFVLDQAPEVLRETIRWGLAWGGMRLLSGLGVAAVCAWAGRRATKSKDDTDAAMGWTALAAVCGLVGLLLIQSGGNEILHILVAPKLYLLHEFTGKHE